MPCFKIAAVVLTALLLSSSSFAQNTRSTLKDSAAAVAAQQENPLTQGVVWPILYFGTEGERGEGVIRGVFPDGRQVKIPAQGMLVPVWSPDGTRFAHVAGGLRNAVLKVMDLQGNVKALFTPEKEALVPSPSWSPDGRRVAIILVRGPTARVSVAVFDVKEQKIRSRFELPPRTIDIDRMQGKLRWSPDGRKILLDEERAVVIHTGTGVIETVAEKPVLEPEWAPDSDAVYYFDLESSLDLRGYRSAHLRGFYLKKLGSTSAIKLMDEEQIKVFGLTKRLARLIMTLSPKGFSLAIALSLISEEGGGITSIVYIYDLREGRTVALDKPFRSFRSSDLIMAIEWAPDEASLAAAVGRGFSINIELLDLTTGAWRTLAADVAPGEAGNFYGYTQKSISWTQ